MKVYSVYIIFLFMFLFSSCEKNELLFEMKEIQIVENHDPSLALLMLDSLKNDVQRYDEYTQRKFDLFYLRLNVKTNHKPTSDYIAKRVVGYFDSKGSNKEKQEAYYYGGCVYRDLKDLPSAFKNCLKSKDIAETYHDDCDSIILQSTYSELYHLFSLVRDYKNALYYARKEYNLSNQLHSNNYMSVVHMLQSYVAIDSTKQAMRISDKIYNHVLENKTDKKVVSSLFCELTHLGDLDKAKVCLSLLNIGHLDKLSNSLLLVLANYYEQCENSDSSIICYQKILLNRPTINETSETMKALFQLNRIRGNNSEAVRYAKRYVEVNESIDLKHRKELKASVNNQFQNNLDKTKEAEEYKKLFILVTTLLIMFASLGMMFYLFRRSRNLKKIFLMSTELEKHKVNETKLHELIENKRKELQTANDVIRELQEKLDGKESLIVQQQTLLDEKDELLSKKMEQYKTVKRYLNMTQILGIDETTINTILTSIKGLKNMTNDDWSRLYAAVDKLDPGFKENIIETFDHFTEQQMQVLYLMRIGLTNPQIQQLTNLPRVTIWRWTKKYNQIINKNENAK